MAADVREEQTFFSFSTRLLSFTALPCGHDENISLPEVCNCSESGRDRRGDASCGSCVSGKPATREKIHGLQADSVVIAPPDMSCFPISRDQACSLKLTHEGLHEKASRGKKNSALGAEMSRL